MCKISPENIFGEKNKKSKVKSLELTFDFSKKLFKIFRGIFFFVRLFLFIDCLSDKK
jgi:hypothetical protein